MKNSMLIRIMRAGSFGIIGLMLFTTSCINSLSEEKPGAVTMAQPTIIYPTAATLTWSEPETDNFAAYRLYYDTVPGVSESSILIATIVLKSATSFQLKNLWENKTYYAKVFTYNSTSVSESNEISFTTVACDCGTFTNERSQSMVRIPAGCFTGKDGTMATITNDYFMDTTEVTEKLWYQVMHDSTVSSLKPKVTISWYQTILFCNKRSLLDKRDTCYTYTDIVIDTVTKVIITLRTLACDFSKNGYRLPTDDEWEYAYRGGRWEEYYWGKDGNTQTEHPYATTYPVTKEDSLEISEYAWWQYNNFPIGPKEVATKKPNVWSLYDMAGNIQEFIWDIMADARILSRVDYRGPKRTPLGKTGRIIRGGRFDYNSLLMTHWWRFYHLEPDIDFKRDVGFRTVATAN